MKTTQMLLMTFDGCRHAPEIVCHFLHEAFIKASRKLVMW